MFCSCFNISIFISWSNEIFFIPKVASYVLHQQLPDATANFLRWCVLWVEHRKHFSSKCNGINSIQFNVESIWESFLKARGYFLEILELFSSFCVAFSVEVIFTVLVYSFLKIFFCFNIWICEKEKRWKYYSIHSRSAPQK